MEHSRRTYARDLISAVLYSGARFALGPLIAFIAVKRLGASVTWVGLLNGAMFVGFVWNFFFSGLTAKLSLRRGIVVILAISSVLYTAAAFQTRALPYCLILLAASVTGGLVGVQYDTLLYHLYAPGDRPRLLSYRSLAVALACAVYAPLFGAMSSGSAGHLPMYLLVGALLAAAALTFRSMRTETEYRMQPFHARDVLAVVIGDRRLRPIAIILTIYGLFGVGVKTILVVLYNQLGFTEWHVGIFTAVATVGMVLTNLTITPFMRFRGALTNFRLCFTSGAASAALYCAAALYGSGPLSAWIIGAAAFVYGVASGGFGVAAQTAVLNIAPKGKVSLYVNAFKIVQGVRGAPFPLIVATALSGISISAALIATLVAALFCGLMVWIPGVDGRPE